MNYRCNIAVVCLVGFLFITNGCNSSKVGPPTKTSKVTLDSFDKIDEGMTMEQVIAILGDESRDTNEIGAQSWALVGVQVSQVAMFHDDSAGDTRRIEIGFNDGKVAVVIYRDGKVAKMKPDVPADSFRLLVDRLPPDILRVVVDVGSPEGMLMALGVGESMDRLDGFGAATPQNTTTFTVTGRLVDNTDAEGQSLEIVLQLLGPKTTSTSTSKFAIDDGKSISDVLAVIDRSRSALYKPGKPIVLGIITGSKDGKKRRIILHVAEKVDEPKESNTTQ